MKNIKFEELKKDALLTQTEPISIEHNGQLVGYYYPAINPEQIEKAKKKHDLMREKILVATGLTESEDLDFSQSDEVEKQVNLGHEFMKEYNETFQELAK